MIEDDYKLTYPPKWDETETECKRFTAKSKEYNQSYFLKEPFFIDNNMFICEFFGDINNRYSIKLNIKDTNYFNNK